MRFFTKKALRQNPTGRIWVCFFAFLILFPWPLAAAQKVVAAISSPKPSGSASAGHPSWLPPDVDENVPPVEETACSVDEVIQKAEERVLEFVHNVDRFTATESLTHQSINKHGQASAPVGRKFNYVVSIHEVRQGHLGVTEYRNGGLALTEFPGGIVTNGLPALVLIFHPYYAPSYEMTCEGLARSNESLRGRFIFVRGQISRTN